MTPDQQNLLKNSELRTSHEEGRLCLILTTDPGHAKASLIISCALHAFAVAVLVCYPLLVEGRLSLDVTTVYAAPKEPTLRAEPLYILMKEPIAITADLPQRALQQPKEISLNLLSPVQPIVLTEIPAELLNPIHPIDSSAAEWPKLDDLVARIFPSLPAPYLPPPNAEPIASPRSVVAQSARLLHRTKPVYPPLALTAGVEGTVLLEAVITSRGEIRDIKIINGHPLLKQAAVDCLKTWKYEAATSNARPVQSRVTVRVNFILNGPVG